MSEKAKMLEMLGDIAKRAQRAANQVPTWAGEKDVESYRNLLRVRDHANEARKLLEQVPNSFDK